MAKELRSGFTTGACAAAGVKAVLLYEQGKYWQEISLTALNGVIINIPIKAITETPAGFCAEVVKFSGDDPDITNGVSVFTTVSHLQNTKEIEFAAGPGIGKVTKAGLSLPIGEPAINNGPRQLIRNVVAEILGNSNAGLKITIAIPAGTKLAKKTLNPILGIEGGISVIGTTGVLRPMSEEGFKNSLVPQIDVAKAAGFKNLIFVPGKIGERIATEWGLPTAAMVQTSNFIGFMLEAAADRGIEQVLLFGHIGKLAKVAAGSFYTHNRIADGRMEIIAAYGGALGIDKAGINSILAAVTTEEALAVLAKYQLKKAVCHKIALRASERAERYLFNKMHIGTVMVTLQGELLGMDMTARKIMQEWGCECLE